MSVNVGVGTSLVTRMGTGIGTGIGLVVGTSAGTGVGGKARVCTRAPDVMWFTKCGKAGVMAASCSSKVLLTPCKV